LIFRHEDNFKAKEDDIRKRDLEIQIHLINFCQYLQENDSKRKKAEERFKQDMEVFNKKEEEIQSTLFASQDSSRKSL
jgi:hypothetical protein